MSTPLVSVITPVKADQPMDIDWLREAIQSVRKQSLKDWELIVVNDHSPLSLKTLSNLFKDEKLSGANASYRGVANARNQAASMAQGKLLVALDHDDLLPQKALEQMANNWEEGVEVYGTTIVRTPNGQRVHRPPAYSFNLLLRQLQMPVGAMHALADWKRSGGWKPAMEKGLEDWEYHITLGEIGVCGKPIKATTYIYRRHAHSRLSHIRQTPGLYTEAWQMMRQLHIDTYNGRPPKMCCGEGSRPRQSIDAIKPVPMAMQAQIQNLQIPVEAVTQPQIVQVRYTGGMKAGFGLVGDVSGFRYQIDGEGALVTLPDGRPGVDRRDVPMLKRINRGHDFQVVGN